MADTILTTFPRHRPRGTICICDIKPKPFNQEAPMLNQTRTIGFTAAGLCVLLLTGPVLSGDLEHVNVYTSGADGYNTFRIPTIETAPDGTLLAFAEARKHNAGDPGTGKNDIDLVLKRSGDGGRTWSAMTVIENPGDRWSAANASTVVDRRSGRVWVFYIRCKPGRGTHQARGGTDDMQVMARTSDDSGKTWSQPIDLTATARDMDDKRWGASVNGPGGAIQTSKGRLIVPVWGYPWRNFAIFSDDAGKTWRRGQCVPGEQTGDECQLVELADGRVLMDFRQQKGPHRYLSVSEDGGQTWSPVRAGQTVTPVMCAVERFSLKSAGAEQDRILWTGPKGPGRANLVARVSYNEAQTFQNERPIYNGPAAYSDLTILKDGAAGVLWERDNYKFITFTRVDKSWLEPK